MTRSIAERDQLEGRMDDEEADEDDNDDIRDRIREIEDSIESDETTAPRSFRLKSWRSVARSCRSIMTAIWSSSAA